MTHHFHHRPALSALLTLLALAGPVAATPTPPQNRPPSLIAGAGPGPAARLELWNRTELYFGTGKPDGSAVTPQEFRRFMDAQVTPRFPDGLTLLAGDGQFRGENGQIVKERSFVLILLYAADVKAANARIEAIRAEYKRIFQQESVLRVDDTAKVSF